ncbi:MAG: hypothetical protein ISQ34_01665 [Rickettsiales bacterium]|nr:hypothetical protein [Rickettsiales bacterium]
MTANGCLATCAAPTINGATTSIIEEGNTATFTCNNTGYAGNELEYTCNNGSLTPTPTVGDCANVSCNSAGGYYASGDSCVQGCSVASITGTTDSGSLVADGVEVTCDDTGYDGTSLGTCSAGTGIAGSCTSCASGYNYNDSQCESQCDLDLTSYGISDTVKVDSGSSTYDCANYGDNTYTGTITLSSDCADGGSVNVSSGTCSSSVTLPECSGGKEANITISSISYHLHVFDTVSASTNFTCTQGGDADILVVAGGGGGIFGGGGGAGGLILNQGYTLSPVTYKIKIGDGGQGGYGFSVSSTRNQYGIAGENSIFDINSQTQTLEAIGGGGIGGSEQGYNIVDISGGSAGGTKESSTTATAISGQGFLGGTSSTANQPGGGGGAGGVGGTGEVGISGDGGLGLDLSGYFGTNYGDNGWFASGGGGGCRFTGSGSASLGGGGNGAPDNSVAGDDAQDKTGGGGGGGRFGHQSKPNDILGGAGGSGIVLIRYTNPD